MTRSLLAILLLLPVSVSAGEVDGKHLFCKSESYSLRLELLGDDFATNDVNLWRSMLGVRFADGEVIERVIFKENGSFYTVDYIIPRYSATAGYIEWTAYQEHKFRLSRKSLTLMEYRSSYSSDNASVYRCELATSEIVEKNLDAQIQVFRQQLVEAKKGNKI